MKSIMQDGPTLTKAINAAWEKAEKPTEFTVKILEHPVSNFLGFVKKPAKIALYFELPRQKTAPTRKPAPDYQQSSRPQRRGPHEGQGQQGHGPQSSGFRRSGQREHVARPQQEHTGHIAPVSDTSERGERHERRERMSSLWTPEMTTFTDQWLKKTLDAMGLTTVRYKIEPSDLHLRITFVGNLHNDPVQEKRLFANYAGLILETLKRNFKVSLRGHKIVLLHATAYDRKSQQQ